MTNVLSLDKVRENIIAPKDALPHMPHRKKAVSSVAVPSAPTKKTMIRRRVIAIEDVDGNTYGWMLLNGNKLGSVIQ